MMPEAQPIGREISDPKVLEFKQKTNEFMDWLIRSAGEAKDSASKTALDMENIKDFANDYRKMVGMI